MADEPSGCHLPIYFTSVPSLKITFFTFWLDLGNGCSNVLKHVQTYMEKNSHIRKITLACTILTSQKWSIWCSLSFSQSKFVISSPGFLKDSPNLFFRCWLPFVPVSMTMILHLSTIFLLFYCIISVLLLFSNLDWLYSQSHIVMSIFCVNWHICLFSSCLPNS